MVTHLRGLCDDGLLSMSCKVRIPDMCRSPSSLLDEVVSLATFHEQVLGLLAHDFFRGLLFYYGIELHHLTHVECSMLRYSL
jgi:hypothetical protein